MTRAGLWAVRTAGALCIAATAWWLVGALREVDDARLRPGEAVLMVLLAGVAVGLASLAGAHRVAGVAVGAAGLALLLKPLLAPARHTGGSGGVAHALGVVAGAHLMFAAPGLVLLGAGVLLARRPGPGATVPLSHEARTAAAALCIAGVLVLAVYYAGAPSPWMVAPMVALGGIAAGLLSHQNQVIRVDPEHVAPRGAGVSAPGDAESEGAESEGAESGLVWRAPRARSAAESWEDIELRGPSDSQRILAPHGEQQSLADAELSGLLRELAAAPSVAPEAVGATAIAPYVVDQRFRVLGRLGVGGMGVVYRALDERLQREVALKVLSPEVVHRPDRRARMLREARAGARVNHRNVAAIYDVDLDGEEPYIAMELVVGRTLRAHLEAGKLASRDALALARELVDGVAAAHAEGIVHRDLKPENVMLAPGGAVKILDFGLARFEDTTLGGGAEPAGAPGAEPAGASAAEPHLTREGKLMGTPAYMAPEQAQGARDVDARADVFALGAVLYELFTGRALFLRGDARTSVEAILSWEGAVEVLAAPEVPAAARAVLARCLAREAQARFEHAGALAEALRAVG